MNNRNKLECEKAINLIESGQKILQQVEDEDTTEEMDEIDEAIENVLEKIREVMPE